MKRILIALLSLPALINAMEAPPQAAAPKSHLVALPTDIKGYLLPYLLSGTATQAVQTIASLSRVDKSFHDFIKKPGNMRIIIKLLPYSALPVLTKANKSFYDFINTPVNMHIILESLPFTAHALDLAGHSGLKSWEGNRPKINKWPVLADKSIAPLLLAKQEKLVFGKELLDAALNKDCNALKLLLANPHVDLNYQGGFGFTALMHAVKTRGEADTIMVKMLLDAGANPNLCNHSSGNTPLHQAAHRAKSEIITILLENGADKKLLNRMGKTAYDRGLHQEKHHRAYSAHGDDSKLALKMLNPAIL